MGVTGHVVVEDASAHMVVEKRDATAHMVVDKKHMSKYKVLVENL
jgi:hypothetical protein